MSYQSTGLTQFTLQYSKFKHSTMKCNDTVKYAGTGPEGLLLPFNMYYYPSSEHSVSFWQFPFATHSPTSATILQVCGSSETQDQGRLTLFSHHYTFSRLSCEESIKIYFTLFWLWPWHNFLKKQLCKHYRKFSDSQPKISLIQDYIFSSVPFKKQS